MEASVYYDDVLPSYVFISEAFPLDSGALVEKSQWGAQEGAEPFLPQSASLKSGLSSAESHILSTVITKVTSDK